MATDISSRLSKLRTRRQGIHAATIVESYEKRASEAATKYALGAMQEVDKRYTDNSIAEGSRVKNQLEKGLTGDIQHAFDYQGSVPLNVHIKGVSDIDLLVLRTDFITFDPLGNKARLGHYSDWGGPSAASALGTLRAKSENILREAFPEAKVDTMGSKAISLSGGSLRRKVDVVPSHWHETPDYQISGQKKDRGVSVLIKDKQKTFLNLPFLHMHAIDEKDRASNGGAKKVIRLLKNLRADSDFSSGIDLNSYEIAGLVWHFRTIDLTVYPWNELALLWVTKLNLDNFVGNRQQTMQLMTPDNTRRILDTDPKFSALAILSLEVDQLVEKVVEELGIEKTYAVMEKRMKEYYIPVL
jgi:hypothetical protein